MTTITVDQMYCITSLAELDYGTSPTSTYSGRGMYGAQCVGWDVQGADEVLRLGAAITTVMGDDAPDMIDSASQDSMGRGVIVYFPGWQCDDPIGEDDE